MRYNKILAAVAMAGFAVVTFSAAAHVSPAYAAQAPTQVSVTTHGQAMAKDAVLKNGAHADPAAVQPFGVGVGVVINIPTATLYQCPAPYCNKGIANASNFPAHHDDIADLRYTPNTTTPWGGNWDVVYDHDNKTVGFISTVYLSDAGGGFNWTSCD